MLHLNLLCAFDSHFFSKGVQKLCWPSFIFLTWIVDTNWLVVDYLPNSSFHHSFWMTPKRPSLSFQLGYQLVKTLVKINSYFQLIKMKTKFFCKDFFLRWSFNNIISNLKMKMSLMIGLKTLRHWRRLFFAKMIDAKS